MLSRRGALATLLVTLIPGPRSGVFAGERVLAERVLAVVDRRPILLSEARLVMGLRGIGERAAVDLLVDEILMWTEASRLPQASITSEEETRALESLREQAPSGATDGADPDRLRVLARRQAMALKYIEFRFRPQLRVDEEALRQRVKAAEAAGQVVDEGDEDRLRAQLLSEELDRRVEAWVSELRAGAEIRYNIP
jgi:hypothetical protein